MKVPLVSVDKDIFTISSSFFSSGNKVAALVCRAPTSFPAPPGSDRLIIRLTRCSSRLNSSRLLSAAIYFKTQKIICNWVWRLVQLYEARQRSGSTRFGKPQTRVQKCSHPSDPLFDSRRAWRSHANPTRAEETKGRTHGPWPGAWWECLVSVRDESQPHGIRTISSVMWHEDRTPHMDVCWLLVVNGKGGWMHTCARYQICQKGTILDVNIR